MGSAMLMLVFSFSTTLQAQPAYPCNSYDFSTAGSWTAYGTTVAISSSQITATLSPDGTAAHYVASPLSYGLVDNWTCDFDFKPTGGSAPCYALVSFSEMDASLSPSICNADGFRLSGCGTMYYTQTDCIQAEILGSGTTPGNWQLRASSKVRTVGAYGSTTTGGAGWVSSSGITLGGASGTTYYARLQRLDETHGMISLFSNSARTTLIGSQCFPIDDDIDNLTAVQSGNMPEGACGRTYSGTVDNITVCNLYPELTGTPTFCASASAKTYTMWNGNSNVSASDCGFPGAVSFTWAAPAGSTFPSGTSGTCNSGSSGLHNDCSIDVNSSGDVTCDIEYSCGTIITYTLSVTVNPSPSAALTVPSSFCDGAAITANGSGSMYGTSFRWAVIEVTDATGSTAAPGASWCQQPFFMGGSPGSVNLGSILGCASFTCGKYYKVRLEVKNSCATSTVYDVFYLACLPTVAVNGAGSICQGTCATLTAVGASTYSWSPTTGLGSPTSASTSACPTSTQVYTVTGTSIYGCTDSENATVTVLPAPSVSLGPDQALCCNNTYTLSPTVSGGTSPYTYAWSTAPGSPTVVLMCSHSGAHSPASTCSEPKFTWNCPPAGASFTLAVTDANGCTANDVIAFSTTPCRLAQNSSDDEHAPDATVYPNPATKQITVSTTGVPDQIFITDALGRYVMNIQPVAEQTQIDLSDLTPGIYFVQIVSGENRQTERLVIEE